MSTTMQPAQRVLLLVLPLAFIPFILQLPRRPVLYWVTTNLWTTGPGARHAAADAQADAAAEALVADAAEARRDGCRERRPSGAEPAEAGAGSSRRATGEAQEEGGARR